MFPSEMAILLANAVTRDSGKKLLTRPMDVVGEYIGYLCDSLVSRGYLKRDGSREYQLTRRAWRLFWSSCMKMKLKSKTR